jgi:hypothetical protein
VSKNRPRCQRTRSDISCSPSSSYESSDTLLDTLLGVRVMRTGCPIPTTRSRTSCWCGPGVRRSPPLLGPARRLLRWFNWSRRWSRRSGEDVVAGEGSDAEEWAEPVELELAPLPCWAGRGEEERQREVRGLLREVEAEARAKGKPVLGARAVQAQHPHTRPERLKRSPRPLGHASTSQALRQLREQYRAFVSAFREAAARWSRGDYSTCFPLFSFPPRVMPDRVARVL